MRAMPRMILRLFTGYNEFSCLAQVVFRSDTQHHEQFGYSWDDQDRVQPFRATSEYGHPPCGCRPESRNPRHVPTIHHVRGPYRDDEPGKSKDQTLSAKEKVR